MKDNFDLYSWNKNRYLGKAKIAKETENKDFDLREWNKKRYLNELDINTTGGDTDVDNLNIDKGGDDAKMGAELESDANVVGENQSHLEFLQKYLSKMHPELRWEISFGERLDAYGSARDLANFGNKYHGKKFGDYEVFHVDDDDRLDIVRVIKSSKLRENKSYHTEEHARFLTALRDSGVTNMFGAGPYLAAEFDLDKREARKILASWMESFSENLNESYMYKGYKDKHFDICPTAEALRDRLLAGEFKDTSWATGTDFEKEVGEWLYQHDILFGTEKQILKDKEGDENDLEVAEQAVDRIVNLSRDLGIPASEINAYIPAHIKKIKDIVEYSSLTESIKETIHFIKENNPEFTNEEIKAELKEIKALGEQLDESMCKRGKNYMAARKRAGEKSSAYLSGRGVKVCKGQIKGSDGKKKKSY